MKGILEVLGVDFSFIEGKLINKKTLAIHERDASDSGL